MKVLVIASGSKGNATLLSCGSTHILIDAGVSFKIVSKALEEQSLTPADLNAILITHTHHDHIAGLASVVKKSKAPVYIVDGMVEELQKRIPSEMLRLIPNQFDIEEIHVELIHTSHDAPASVGYIMSDGRHSLVYVTDTGYINQKYFSQMQDKEIYIMESNHDEKMLMDGPYPYYLKQRVVGDEGHLSNMTASSYLTKMIGPATKYIVLAHLSEQNNTEEMALKTLTETLSTKQLDQSVIYIAKQHEETPLIEV